LGVRSEKKGGTSKLKRKTSGRSRALAGTKKEGEVKVKKQLSSWKFAGVQSQKSVT